MSPKQTQLYWREFAAVQRACKAAARPPADRHELHARALGADKSSKHFTNADFDKVLGVFRSISRPADVTAQVQQIHQPVRRNFGHLEEVLRCLALYPRNAGEEPMGRAGAEAYAREIIRDKFNGGSRRVVSEIADLSDTPRGYVDSDGALIELPSQLRQLTMTLERALNGREGFRNAAGDTLHQMKMRAGVRCACAPCRRGALPVPAFVEEAVAVAAGVEEGDPVW